MRILYARTSTIGHSTDRELRVNTLEDALSIFSEFKGRKLNIVESSGIQSGFERSLEK